MIVHLMHNEKFIAPFIEFIKKYFNFEEHFFILVGGVDEKIAKIPQYNNILYLDHSYNNKWKYFKYSKILKSYMYQADKILLHFMFGDNKNFFLFNNKRLLSKCYWIMWGADLYVFNKPQITLKDKIRHYVRSHVYKRIGHFVTQIKGDYELAKKWYGVKGKYHDCFVYPSNLYRDYELKSKKHNSINIQLGNSADPTNNHIEVLNQLKKYKDENIKIFSPLSYGDKDYSLNVIAKGKELFGNKFFALTDFMPYEKYLEFLGNIDIAIFAHKRQQAMGNTIILLGLGKKVYMRNDITSWNFFKDINVKVFDVANIEIDLIAEKTKKENQQKIKEYFSENNLKRQLESIFNEN